MNIISIRKCNVDKVIVSEKIHVGAKMLFQVRSYSFYVSMHGAKSKTVSVRHKV